MSIRIHLDQPPEFYTNLDVIRGHVVLSLSRHEQIGAIIVKLEGESRTALGIPSDNSTHGVPHRDMPSSGDVIYENHKILYKVAQAFPDERASIPGPIVLAPGQHRFPFEFKFPFNNSCGNTEAMAKIGGVVNAGGFAPGSGLFGLGGIRVMDGTKQLMYSHVTKTLPPSFTGFPGEAEIRYYVKTTIQRPGLFKENWRQHVGLKFLPIEPPRPAKSNQEAYARRPFTFQPRTPPSTAPQNKKRTSFFGRSATPQSSSSPAGGSNLAPPDGQPVVETPPSIEMSARLPHPPILTCNKPIPLRLIAKKMVPSNAEVYMVALQIDLIGRTIVRCQDLVNNEVNRWVIVSRQGLSIPVSKPADAVGAEVVLDDVIWGNVALPNTVMPTFLTCNLSREYQLEVRIGLSWGKPQSPSSSHPPSFFGGGGGNRHKGKDIAQELHLPLHFSSVQVFSGLTPPPELVEAMRTGRARPPRKQTTASTNNRPPQSPNIASSSTRPQQAPSLPPRPVQPQAPVQPQPQQPQQPPSDPLYPPQLRPGQDAPPYDDAPPTYEEAMAEEMTGPVIPTTARPAYSGVTDENAASSLPEKN